MASLNMSSFSSALKILYPDSLEEVWFPEAPFLAWVPKAYDFEGASKQSNAIISGIRGSADFSAALNGKGTPSLVKFNVTRKKDYVIGSIDNETMMASASNRGAIAKAIKVQVDAAAYEYGRSAAFQCWSDGSGVRATMTAYNAGTNVATLNDRRDCVKFEIGMNCEVKDSVTGVISPGYLQVVAVDLDLGTVTFSLQGGAVAPVIANDETQLGRQGDFLAGVGQSNCMSGVFAWIPVATPSATPFFGVDRSVNPQRLAGSRVRGGAKTIEEIIFDSLARGRVAGGKFDTLWMNSERASELQKSMQAKAFVDVQSAGKAKVGFQGFNLVSPQGNLMVMDDPTCPYAYGLLTRRDAWEFASLGDAPHFAEEDGRRFLRESTSDGIEFRLKAYANLICQRPIDNVLIDFDGV
jgi:hypothetical protein